VSVKPAFGCGNCDGNHVYFILSSERMARPPSEFPGCTL
jgi:hypothetical protein